MSEEKNNSIEPNITIKLLTEDIQAHRDYIQRLYTAAFAVGAVLIAAGVGLGYWVLGKQLDAKVFEYRIVESLRNRANNISSEIIYDAKLAAQNEVSDFIQNEISTEVEKQIGLKLQEFSQETLQDLFERFAFPYGTVVAVNRDTCPKGWVEYKPAYGRFIRGIDKSGNSIDPAGERIAGSTQDDQYEKHSHEIPHNVWEKGGKGTVEGGGMYGYTHSSRNRSPDTGPAGGNETRPKNVSLLFCTKNIDS